MKADLLTFRRSYPAIYFYSYQIRKAAVSRDHARMCTPADRKSRDMTYLADVWNERSVC
jgi:hypothetical protein